MNSEVKTPQSQLRWQAKYDKEKMKTTGIKHSTKEREKWDNAADINGMKLATFVRTCVSYCIDNGIDIANYIPETAPESEEE